MHRILGVALTGLLVVGLGGPSAGIPPVDDLPRGADTVVPHLVHEDPIAVEASDVDVPLPSEVTSGNNAIKLVGRTDLGWLVSAAYVDSEGIQDHESLHLVTATGSTQILGLDQSQEGRSHYRLSSTRKRVLRWTDDSPAYLTVYTLTGQIVAERRISPAWVWDFSGTRVLYGNRSWRIGEAPRTLTTRRVGFADIGNNTLVVRGSNARWAFATLTRPGRLRWQAHFKPAIISPDGSRVAGWAETKLGVTRDVVQVRRMTDGKLLSTIDVSTAGTEWRDPLRWEGNYAVLFRAWTDGAVLVKCTLARVCSRVSDHASGFSFALRPGTTR
jgi:hypothetical protein